MPSQIHPRLIRPERDGKVGEWSYLYNVKGQDYIFPALVNELGNLKPLVYADSEDPYKSVKTGDSNPSAKVIYWKASEWETKFLPLAVEWIRKHGFTMPDIPFYEMELRKIEDRDGDERVTEVMHFFGVPVELLDDGGFPILFAYQFKEVGGEEGRGQRPLMQWWLQSVIRFKNGEIDASGWCVANAYKRLANWSDFPQITKDLVEKHGFENSFKILTVHGSSNPDPTDDEIRNVTFWIAFCLYINSLKPTGEAVEPTGRKNRSAPKTLEEVVALEQATILKSAGILKSGVRRKIVATGEGTKHRYRYLVRGHERVINGKSIWIKPQIRGEGEFMVLPTATTPEVQAAIPAMPVTVHVPREETRIEPTPLPPAPGREYSPRTKPHRVGLVAALMAYLTTIFRRA